MRDLRWLNTTNLPSRDLRRLYRAILTHLGQVPAHDVYVGDCLTGIGCGHAMAEGPKRVFVSVPRTERQATAQWPAGMLWGRLETFVHIAAHEARHLWQWERDRRMDELDADDYAVLMLRFYRTGRL